ncbi:MAG: hypothetical protein ILA19_03220 [Bacilli bacterium]|nr:hypothetical protein [Bacilli bacterium]
MKKRVELEGEPLVEINGQIGIKDYKGWSVKACFMVDEKVASVIISNKKLGIAQSIVRKCHIHEIHWWRKEGGILNFKEVEEVRTNYLEFETINDLMEEAKTIIDMYDMMKKQILEETKIKELEYGFEKVEFVKRG